MLQPLSAITLQHFRSYSEASFEFDDGVNIIIGPNAVGKTNLLEAVYLACFGKGFRSKSDSDLIQSLELWARVDCSFGSVSRTVKLEKMSDQSRLKKRFEIGGHITARLSYRDLVPVVLFQPDDIRLAVGGPERRRNYIDILLTKLIPSYRQDLLAYERTLKQRNTLLKQGGVNGQLFAWNVQLAELGGRIVERRKRLIDILDSRLSDTYSDVAGKPYELSISYQSSLPLENYSSAFLRGLESRKNFDRDKGYTTIGPHRDDFHLFINRQPMKDVASRGENRTLILALKMIELDEIKSHTQLKPLLLLDDVFSELDGTRRRFLTTYLTTYQTLITTTDADMIDKKYLSTTRTMMMQPNT